MRKYNAPQDFPPKRSRIQLATALPKSRYVENYKIENQ